jgi:hypothetical protein
MPTTHDVRHQTGSIEPKAVPAQNHSPAVEYLANRRLHTKEEAMQILHLFPEQFEELANTRQLTPFRIAGVERFDSRDLDKLIDAYKETARRRLQ